MKTKEVKISIADALPQMLSELFPNRPIKPSQGGWRIGNNNSLAIQRDGAFFCHESGACGDALDLIQYALGTDFLGALNWAKNRTKAPAASGKAANYLVQKPKDVCRAERVAKAKGIWIQSQAPLDWRPSCNR